jgi:2,5-furandicarboxylate decarboxylase 1
MSFRTYLERLKQEDRIQAITGLISKEFECAAALKAFEPQPVLFTHINGFEIPVIGNLFCSKKSFGDYFDIPTSRIIPFLTDAITNPQPCGQTTSPPCQEVILDKPNLDALPILKHFESDGGPYITSGIVIAKHPEHGQNMDFHRCMQISRNQMAMRVVRGRHFSTYLDELGQVDIALCIGNAPNVLAAAAISVNIEDDELGIANALEPLLTTKAQSVDLIIPADTEIVIEGTVFRDQRRSEGPFVDLTETHDIIRQEPLFEVRCITHRNNPIYQALLPGSLEHKLLMGMPREPTIFRAVNNVVICLDVNINPGGCSWLHAIVKIDKQNDDDGKLAIEAAFAGHSSCKHVYVVDSDIDIYNPIDVEWAMATRFQGHKDLVLKDREPGSSLDPSAETGSKLTTKMGFDLTAPLGAQRHAYTRVAYPPIDLTKYA